MKAKIVSGECRSTSGVPLRLRRRASALVALAVSAVVAGCAGTGAGVDRSLSSQPPAGHRIEVIRSYEHEVKTPDGPVRQVVEYGWDYTDAVTVERTTTPDGRPVSFRQVPGESLRANEAELQRAIEIAKQHDDLRETLATEGAHFEGGFTHMIPDDPHCHLRSRCIYVFATLDQGRKKIAQAIVDLQTGQVVYPFFDPGLVGPGN